MRFLILSIKNLDMFSINKQNVTKTKWKWLIVFNLFEKKKIVCDRNFHTEV